VIKQVEKSKLKSASVFFSESKILYASAHPNVVQIHYACEDNEFVYLAMPYYRRGAVDKLINGSFMTVREIIAVACQVLAGLHHVHSKGLVHFDIKPDNILLSDRGEAMLSDFGLAKQLMLGLAQPDGFYAPMLPPEAFTQQKHDHRFDIYQVGLTLYRMCVGNPAFYAQLGVYGPPGSFDAARFHADLVAGRFPNLKAYPPQIPARVRNVIKRCLRAQPADRYGAAMEVANDLAQVDGPILDWRMSEAAGARTWTKSAGGYEITLKLEPGGKSECFKCNSEGKSRKVTAMTRPRLDDKDVAKFLEAT
jgi:serine/threonine protein kinase